MGNETSAPKANLKQQQEQQRREHNLQAQLLKAQEEARRKEFEYQQKLALLKAQNEAKLKKLQQETLPKAIDQNVTKAAKSQDKSENNPSAGDVTYSTMTECIYPQLPVDHGRTTPSSHQGISQPAVPPATSVSSYPFRTQSTSQFGAGPHTHNARADNFQPQFTADHRRAKPHSQHRISPAPSAPPYPLQTQRTTASTSQFDVGSKKNANATECTHYPRAENLDSLPTIDHRRPRPSSHQRISPAPTAPYPLQTQSPPPVMNLERFICVTCNGDKIGLTTFICTAGHRSCKTCKIKKRRCGQCSQPITASQRTVLGGDIGGDIENKANKSSKGGSFARLAGNNNRYKELAITCKGFDCDWIGQLSGLKNHYTEKHREKLATVASEIPIPVNVDMSTPYLLNLGTFTFLFYVKSVDDNLYLFVQNIGSKHANNWNYEIHIYDKSQSCRKYTFTNICLPASSTVEQIISNQDCCILPRLGFIDTYVHNGILTLKVFIKRFNITIR